MDIVGSRCATGSAPSVYQEITGNFGAPIVTWYSVDLLIRDDQGLRYQMDILPPEDVGEIEQGAQDIISLYQFIPSEYP